MYALPRGPSKIIASTRRGPTKPLDNLENRDTRKESGGPCTMSSPKPTFNHGHNHLNGKRSGMTRISVPQEPPFPQHEEIIRYISDAWNKVNHELENSARNKKDGGPSVYKDKCPHNPALANFKAFDLPIYWGQRPLQNLNLPGSG